MARMVWVLTTLFLIGFEVQAQTVHDIVIQPVDLAETGKIEAWPTAVSQLVPTDNGFYLRSAREPRLWRLDRDGNMIKVLGGPGQGPGELGDYGPRAIAHDGNLLTVFSPQLKRMSVFKSDQFAGSFRLKVPTYPSNPLIAKGTAVREEVLVVPSYFETEQLTAAVYDSDGEHLQNIGTTIKAGGDALAAFQLRNQTFWLQDGDNWVSVHTFVPQISLFDSQFREQNFWWASDPRINDLLTETIDTLEAGKFPNPVINDAQLFRGDLYLSAGGQLHRFSLSNGEITDVFRFRGEGEPFDSMEHPFVALMFFAIEDSGRMLLAHPAMMWGHDMWTAQLPNTILNKPGSVQGNGE